MESISTLYQLLNELSLVSENDYKKIVSKLALNPDELSSYAFWEADSYTRNCIVRTPDYELILICWDKGTCSKVHCHSGEDCWMYLVEGELKEQRYKVNDEGNLIKTQSLKMNTEDYTRSYMHDRMGFHSIHNMAEGRSMSLHLYAKPIDTCNCYHEDKESFEPKDLSYFSYEGKPNVEVF